MRDTPRPEDRAVHIGCECGEPQCRFRPVHRLPGRRPECLESATVFVHRIVTGNAMTPYRIRKRPLCQHAESGLRRLFHRTVETGLIEEIDRCLDYLEPAAGNRKIE